MALMRIEEDRHIKVSAETAGTPIILSFRMTTQIQTAMTSGSAPVTEYPLIKLKEGKELKEGKREEVERLIGELQQKISTAERYHASSWGQSVDLGKEYVYIFVLGWDTADVESFQREEISKY